MKKFSNYQILEQKELFDKIEKIHSEFKWILNQIVHRNRSNDDTCDMWFNFTLIPRGKVGSLFFI